MKPNKKPQALDRSAFDGLRKELEDKNYFDFSPEKRNLVDRMGAKGGPLPIEAWSFVPHPDILPLFAPLERHLVMVDTLTSIIYFPVLEFLREQKANLVAYYTGGWADFICDVQLGRKEFDSWLIELKNVLRHGLKEWARNEADEGTGVDNLVTVFEVQKTHVACKKWIDQLAPPSLAIKEEIRREPDRFEQALRDYRSDETRKKFDGDDKKVRSYLRRLKKSGAILCYKVICDTPYYFSRDYVALRMDLRRDGDRPLRDKLKAGGDVLKPVLEFFSVDKQGESGIDPSESTVTHFFINDYELPGDRISWKSNIYKCGVSDINVYNYALEGIANETPFYLSDYPEFLKRTGAYQEPSGIPVGYGAHPSVQGKGPVIRLPFDGMGYGGVILGIPKTGKTNTGLVITAGFLDHAANVVILDGTQGVWHKIPKGLSQKATLNSEKKRALSDDVMRSVLGKQGIVVVEFDQSLAGEMLEQTLEAITRMEDASHGNSKRPIRSALIIEEASHSWAGDPVAVRSRFEKLVNVLDVAMRKGWSIWLSTQRPTRLGPDAGAAILY